MKLNIEQIFYSNNQKVYDVVAEICALDEGVCKYGLYEISEKNNTVNNIKRMPVINGHFPSGSSVKNMQHFSQYIKNSTFCKYDYGKKGNQKIYGTDKPPVYDLKSITFPIHLFVGKYDRLADLKDARIL